MRTCLLGGFGEVTCVSLRGDQVESRFEFLRVLLVVVDERVDVDLDAGLASPPTVPRTPTAYLGTIPSTQHQMVRMWHIPQRIQGIARVKRRGLALRIRKALVPVDLGAGQPALQVPRVPGKSGRKHTHRHNQSHETLPRRIIDHARVALVRPRRRRLGDEPAEVRDAPLSAVVTGELAVALSLGQTHSVRDVNSCLYLPFACAAGIRRTIPRG